MSPRTYSVGPAISRCMLQILILSSLLAGVSGVAVADNDLDQPLSLRSVITFDPRDFEATPSGEYHHVRMYGASLDRMKSHVNQPQLPVAVIWFVLPPGRTIEHLDIIPIERVVIPGHFRPYPILAEDNEALEPPASPPWDQIVYPERPGFIVASGMARRYRLAKVAIWPLEYDAATERISIIRSAHIELTLRPLTAGEDANVLKILRPECADDPFHRKRAWIRRTVVNPDDLPRFYPTYKHRETGGNNTVSPLASGSTVTPYGSYMSDWPSLEGTDVPYVIITNNRDENGSDIGNLRAVFQDWADQLTEFGWPTRVVTVDAIKDQYLWESDRSTAIRTFLQEAAQLWGTCYVLLAGDESVVPTRRFGGPNQGSDWRRPDPPADFWYMRLGAAVDSLWNLNGDAWLAENRDDIDLGEHAAHDFISLYVSRLPARNAGEAQVMLTKTRRYLCFPPFESGAANGSFYRTATVACGPTNAVALDDLNNGILRGELMVESLGDGWTTNRLYPMLGTTRRRCDPTDPQDTTTVVCYEELHGYIKSIVGGDPNDYWQSDDLRDLLNTDTHVLYHIEHSLRQYLGRPSVRSGSPARLPPINGDCLNLERDSCRCDLDAYFQDHIEKLDVNQVLTLTNASGPEARYFFVFSGGSWTNMMDMDAVSEAFLRAPSGGAVFYVGNTLTAAGSHLHTINARALDYIFGSEEAEEFLLHGWFDAIDDEFSGTSFAELEYACQLPPICDPIIWPWKDTPCPASFVVSPNPIPIGAERIDVCVRWDGTQSAIDSAFVCLRQGDLLYARQQSNEQGMAVFDVQIQDDEDIIISAFKPGLRPSSITMPVTAEKAFVGYASHSIDDCLPGSDCDGVAEAGDSVAIVTTLVNRGGAAAQMGFARLRPTPSIVLDLKINGSFRPIDTLLGKLSAPAPAAADTFRIPVTREGIRVEGEPRAPQMLDRESFRVWRDEETGVYTVGCVSKSQCPDSIFTGIIRGNGDFSDVSVVGERGDQYFWMGDSIWFQFRGDASEDRLIFRAQAPNWLTLGTSAVPIPGLGPGDSTSVTFTAGLLKEIPDQGNVVFTVTVSSGIVSQSYYNSDFVVVTSKPTVELVSVLETFGDFGCQDTTWQWTPTICNKGSAQADSVVLTLRKTAGTLTVLDSVVTFSSIEPNAFAANGSFYLCGSSVSDTAGFEASIRQETIGKNQLYDLAVIDRGGGGLWGIPRNLRADLLDGTVLLRWDPVEGADRYAIRYRVGEEGSATYLAVIGTEAARYEVQTSLEAPGENGSGYDYPYYFTVSSLIETQEGYWWEGPISAEVGPIYPWVRERDGWPQLLPESSVCAPLVADLTCWEPGLRAIFAATDKIYAWRPDGSPLSSDPEVGSLFYDPALYDPSLEERAPEQRFQEAMAFGDWDDRYPNEEIAAYLQGSGLHVIGFHSDWQYGCCLGWTDWTDPIFARSSPIVAKHLTPANKAVLFVPGTRGTHLHAFYGNPEYEGVGDAGRFASYPDGAENNFRSLAIGRYNGDSEEDFVSEVIATTRNGNIYCFPTNDLTQLSEPRWWHQLDPNEEPEWLSTPAVGDIDGDNDNDVVVTSRWRSGTPEDIAGRIVIIDEDSENGDIIADSSSTHWHFCGPTDDFPPPGPALAQLDPDDGLNDGLEIVVPSTSPSPYHYADPDSVELYIHVFDLKDGALVHHVAVDSIPYTQRNDEAGGLYPIGTPIVGDFDYDGLSEKPDILVCTSVGAIFAFEYDCQKEPPESPLYAKPGWPLLLPDVPREPVLAELDPEWNPGQFSLVVQCQDGWLHVYDLPVRMPATREIYWPRYGRDGGNTRAILSGGSLAMPKGPPTLQLGRGVKIEKICPVPSLGRQEITVVAQRPESVCLDLFDVAGRRIRRVHNAKIDAGETVIVWDGRQENGEPIPSGIYWYRLTWLGGTERRRVVFVR